MLGARAAFATFGLALLANAAFANAASVLSPTDLKRLAFDDLMAVEVMSVSKRPERLHDAPASVFVITAEDIRRSGATSLPEALRLAPALQVARMTASQYAISARGFNNAVGNKLLVLIDGRTIYTPLFSGVFWDQQDILLEDIDRIEVISGPGATLWGANAVNGVINILTRPARDTEGLSAGASTGGLDDNVALRYGHRVGSAGHLRVYGKSSHADNTETGSGAPILDDWERDQAGFRGDWTGDNGEFVFMGDAYRGASEHRGIVGPYDLTPLEVSGANLLARWTRQFSGGSDLHVQAYYDHMKREDVILFRPTSHIFDVEFQHGLRLGAHQVVWGAGYRSAHDEVKAGILTAFIPSTGHLDWENVFVQDAVELRKNVTLTAGMRLERNDYTAWEWLPSGRVAWKPWDQLLVWSTASRAVRAPSRLDREVFFPGAPPYSVVGGPRFQSEVANVYELGYRVMPAGPFSLSMTAFLHDWRRLRSGTAVPVELENKIDGNVYGVETWAGYQVAPWWRWSGGIALLREDLWLVDGSTDPVGTDNPNLTNDPETQWNVRSSIDLPAHTELDLIARGVGQLPHPEVPGYTALDVRTAWFPVPDLELSLTAQNLFSANHAEFGDTPARSEFGQSVYARLAWSH